MGELAIGVRLARAAVTAYASRPLLFGGRLVGSALSVSVEVAGIVLLLAQFGRLGGWDVHEVVVLIGLAESGLGLALAVSNRLDPSIFGRLVRSGEFDQVLTRPVSPLVWLLASDVQLRELGRLVVGIGALAWAASGAGVAWTPGHLAVAALSIVSCMLVVLGVFVAGAAAVFVTGQGSEFVSALSFGGVTFATYPVQIFDAGLRIVFTYMVPIALTVYVPALWLLDRQGPAYDTRVLLGLAPVAALAFFGVALLAWRRGVRRYQGSGS